jgi:hypothetical protein
VEEKIHEKYGHVVRVGPNRLSFSSLEDCSAIYGFNKCIGKGYFYDFARDKNTENLFCTRTEATHRDTRRKTFKTAFSTDNVIAYDPVVVKNVDLFRSRIESQLVRQDGNDNVLNVVRLCHCFVIDTILEFMLGSTVCPRPWTDRSTTSGLSEALKFASKLSGGVGIIPLLSRLLTLPWVMSWLRKPARNATGEPTNLGAVYAACQASVFEHPELASQSSQVSVVKSWLRVPGGDSRKMESEELHNELSKIMFAGHGSTTAALIATIFMLGSQEGQEWQEKIRLEANDFSIVPGPTTLFPPVLLAVIKESMRLHPPLPFSFPRTVGVGGENAIPNLPAPVPAGTEVSVNPYVMGRSREVWGHTAREWLPERWLGERKEEGSLDDKLFVFSKGSRSCMGRELAMLMLARAVVNILSRWEIKSVGQLKSGFFLDMAYEDCSISFNDLSL